jgi:hypothetical protein
VHQEWQDNNMADNPYSYMQQTEEDDPWRNYQPWQVSSPSIPTFPTLSQGNPTYGQNPDYTIPGNNDAEGNPVTYPGSWGAQGFVGSSPFWGATMPTMYTDAVTNPMLAARRSFRTSGSASGTSNASPPASTIPAPTTGTGTGTTPDSTQRTVTTPQEWAYWNQPDQQLKALQTWGQVYLPYVQSQQNAFQWQNEFGEAARRYDIDTSWRQQLEAYNVDLATRQQQMNELVAQDQSYQWRNEFQRQADNDAFAQDLANRELALASERMGRELTLAEQAEVWRQTYQAAQLDIERQQIAAQLEAARYAAFGRSQRPAAFVANWG